jgi:multidrug efflux pump subunit AcrA (membrane-fusion protein)
MAGDQQRLATYRGRRRNLAFVLSVAVMFAFAGWLAGRSIADPRTVPTSATGPTHPVTAPVELRPLSSSVITRGDLRPVTAVDVNATASLEDTAAVVTGRVPAVGAALAEGSVIVEIAGRPIILLRGSFGNYRSLHGGSTGPDVLQLEQALARLGHFKGKPDATFDSATSKALESLYAAAGYRPAPTAASDLQRLASAQDLLSSARQQLATARANLTLAAAPPAPSLILQAQAAVAVARTQVESAEAALDDAVAAAAPPLVIHELQAQVLQAKATLATAQAELLALTQLPDLTSFRAAVTDAKTREAAAVTEFAQAQLAAGSWLPRGEVVFAPSTPMTVDKVDAPLGGAPGVPAVRLAGGGRLIIAGVSADEARLIKPGQPIQVDGQGLQATATVTEVDRTPGTRGVDAARYAVVATLPAGSLPGLTAANLRVVIPVRTTGGPVLAVPLAALSTRPDGSTWVRRTDDTTVTDIRVTVGLSAEGYAEVTPIGANLHAGDRVVVGQW